MTKESDMTDALQQEMNEVMLLCHQIMKWNPDVVVTEKGVSDLGTYLNNEFSPTLPFETKYISY